MSTAVDVIAGRVSSQKAAAIEKIYTRSAMTKGLWYVGDKIRCGIFDWIFE